MNRKEKIQLLQRIRAGEAELGELIQIELVFYDQQLPESDRRYYILKDDKPVEINKALVNKIKTHVIFFDLDLMYA